LRAARQARKEAAEPSTDFDAGGEHLAVIVAVWPTTVRFDSQPVGDTMQPSRARLAVSLAVVLAGALAFGSRPVFAQPAAGKLEQVRVHGAALDGNLSGDDATRDVFVYLPPSYTREPTRRYPVIYFLHGSPRRRRLT
jgi:hypothetical protein